MIAAIMNHIIEASCHAGISKQPRKRDEIRNNAPGTVSAPALTLLSTASGSYPFGLAVREVGPRAGLRLEERPAGLVLHRHLAAQVSGHFGEAEERSGGVPQCRR